MYSRRFLASYVALGINQYQILIRQLYLVIHFSGLRM